ncbi:MAG: hypothetical protein K2X39_06750, partial [Silvanigrellaceae bacterium]|nr:hypothetical protein [Silvanigrellaceae bacterium]
GYQITVLGKTFIYPMGLYSTKINSLCAIKIGSLVGLPNDPSNQGRALILMHNAGILKLKDPKNEFSTPSDIAENPYQLKFNPVEAAQLARLVQDVDLVVINNDFVKLAGLSDQQELFVETSENAKDYANVIAVREADLNKPELQSLKKILNSPEITAITQRLFGNAIPVW